MMEQLDFEVGNALIKSLSTIGAERLHAEQTLHFHSQRRGHCLRLLALSQANRGLPDDARLLASTMLKNEILRRWRPGARGIDDAEQPELRAAMIERLTQAESSEKVGIQLALSIARVMRSEANRGQTTVLEGFVDTLRRSLLPSHALLALLHTSKELRSMRLPPQRKLASQVGMAMVPCLLPLWRSAIESAFEQDGGTTLASRLEVIQKANLFTKVLRQLLALSPFGCPLVIVLERVARESGTCYAAAALSASVADVAAKVHELSSRLPAIVETDCRALWGRLGAALGKLLIEFVDGILAYRGAIQ